MKKYRLPYRFGLRICGFLLAALTVMADCQRESPAGVGPETEVPVPTLPYKEIAVTDSMAKSLRPYIIFGDDGSNYYVLCAPESSLQSPPMDLSKPYSLVVGMIDDSAQLVSLKSIPLTGYPFPGPYPFSALPGTASLVFTINSIDIPSSFPYHIGALRIDTTGAILRTCAITYPDLYWYRYATKPNGNIIVLHQALETNGRSIDKYEYSGTGEIVDTIRNLPPDDMLVECVHAISDSEYAVGGYGPELKARIVIYRNDSLVRDMSLEDSTFAGRWMNVYAIGRNQNSDKLIAGVTVENSNACVVFTIELATGAYTSNPMDETRFAFVSRVAGYYVWSFSDLKRFSPDHTLLWTQTTEAADSILPQDVYLYCQYPYEDSHGNVVLLGKPSTWGETIGFIARISPEGVKL